MPLHWEIFLEHFLNGLTLSGFYALITLGLALSFGVIKIVNFAHGDLFMMASYTLAVLFGLESISLPYFAIIPIVMLAGALYAGLLERVAIHPIIGKSWRTHAITTLGLSIILQNAAQLIFTTDPRPVPSPLTSIILTPLGIRTSAQRLLVLVVVAIVFFGLQWFVKYTKLGKTMRAVSQNRDMCEVVGINVRQIALITFALGGAITGLAAALMAPLFCVHPTMGSMLTLKALVAIVMGGMGHVNGAVYAAFILGMVESFFGGYVSFAYKDVISFGLFLLVLFVRPRGLFGRRIGL